MQKVESRFDSILSDLSTSGFAIAPAFFSTDHARQLVSESETRWKRGHFRAAAVGRGAGLRIHTELRTDEVDWLEPGNLSEAQALYWVEMNALREALNRNLYLGLHELEAHLARYAPGAFYRPHLDRHLSTSARVLSAVTYLDEDWEESQGGQLRLYTDPESGINGPFIDIFPKPGQLVLFVSAEFWHEVCVSTRHRHSLTGWFREREQPFS